MAPSLSFTCYTGIVTATTLKVGQEKAHFFPIWITQVHVHPKDKFFDVFGSHQAIEFPTKAWAAYSHSASVGRSIIW